MYNAETGEIFSFKIHPLRVTRFLTSWKTLKNTQYERFLSFTKLHLKTSHFTCHTSAAKRLGREKSCCGCGAVKIVFLNFHVSTAKSIHQNTFSLLIKTYYTTHVTFIIQTKHTVRPQRRSHFVFHFFLLCSTCASSPHAVKNSNISLKQSIP